MKIFLNKYSLLISWLFIILISAIIRVTSYKYGLDTNTLIQVLGSLWQENSAIIYEPSIGWKNHHMFHLNFIYYLISPIYKFNTSVIIFIWKFIPYSCVAIVFYKIIIDSLKIDMKYKKIIFIFLMFQPILLTNLVSPDIWDSDLSLIFISTSIYYASKNKYFLSSLLILPIIFIKEDLALLCIFYGILLAIESKKTYFLALSFFSLAYFLIATLVVMPELSGPNRELGLLKYTFGDLGNSLGEIIVNSIIHPGMVINNGFILRKIISLLIIFGCLGFLPFRTLSSIKYLIPTIPIFGFTFLASQPMLDYSKHYLVSIIPFLLYSSIVSINSIKLNIKYIYVLTLISITLFVSHIIFRSWWYYFIPANNISQIIKFKEEHIKPKSFILTGAISSPWICRDITCEVFGGHVIRNFNDFNFDYIIFNVKELFWEIQNCNDLNYFKKGLNHIIADKKYKLIYSNDSILVLKNNNGAVEEIINEGNFNLDNVSNVDCSKNTFINSIKGL